MTRRRPICLALLPLGLLAACGDGPDQRQVAAANASAGIDVMTGEEVTAQLLDASVGPLRFDYDAHALTLIEMPVMFPIGPEKQTWGAKLMPADRADLLGEQGCVYGNPPRRRTCNARDEGGLVVSLLERPIDDYREHFRRAGLIDQVQPDALAGVAGFSYLRDRFGKQSRYRFIPVGERTLMVGEQDLPVANEAARQAIQQAIRSLAAALPTPD